MNRRAQQELTINAVKRAWLDHPDDRLGQILWRVAEANQECGGQMFTLTDKELLAGLRNNDCCSDETPTPEKDPTT